MLQHVTEQDLTFRGKGGVTHILEGSMLSQLFKLQPYLGWTRPFQTKLKKLTPIQSETNIYSIKFLIYIIHWFINCYLYYIRLDLLWTTTDLCLCSSNKPECGMLTNLSNCLVGKEAENFHHWGVWFHINQRTAVNPLSEFACLLVWIGEIENIENSVQLNGWPWNKSFLQVWQNTECQKIIMQKNIALHMYMFLETNCKVYMVHAEYNSV